MIPMYGRADGEFAPLEAAMHEREPNHGDFSEGSDADRAEQAEPWDREETEVKPRIPLDAPEADVLDQSRPADLDDEERDR